MIISLDTEYSDLNVRKASLLSISIGTSTDELLFKPNELHKVKEITDKAKIILVQNGVVDWYILNKNGLNLDRSKFLDCMLMEHLIDERLDHDLGSMAVRHFNDPYKEAFWSKYDLFSDAPEHEANEYERKDARYTYDLGIKFLDQLKSKIRLVEHVHKLQWCLFDTEIEGIRIDVDLVKKTEIEVSNKIQSLLPKLREEFNDYCEIWEMRKWQEEIDKRKSDLGKSRVGRPTFNFASDYQLRELLYSEYLLGLKTKSKTKKGNPSTDYDTLEELVTRHPEIRTIFEYKQEKAVYSTFIKGMLERIDNGRVHPHFGVNGTETGRLSSSNPNFQNMPQEGVIRNFILPDEGCMIVGADFEGLEVGVEANLTEDPALLSILLDNKNKHDITAAAVNMERKDAKTLNFLCQYGGGVKKIQKTFGVTETVAKEIFDKYWNAYYGVVQYKSRVFKELAETGSVTNCFGRTRHFHRPRSEYEQASHERKAYSHMVQGPGAEMTNMATYLIADYFKKNSLGRLMYSVHDEIVCSAKKDRTEEAKAAIVNIMESTNDLIGFKYKIKAKSYGPFECWKKA
jgi:DNA polymerase I